jgi:hypothetical protein
VDRPTGPLPGYGRHLRPRQPPRPRRRRSDRRDHACTLAMARGRSCPSVREQPGSVAIGIVPPHPAMW